MPIKGNSTKQAGLSRLKNKNKYFKSIGLQHRILYKNSYDDLFSAQGRPLIKDNTVTFNANNTTTFKDEGVVCSPSADEIGTWTLTGNTINLDGSDTKVSNFSCTGMVFTDTEDTEFNLWVENP